MGKKEKEKEKFGSAKALTTIDEILTEEDINPTLIEKIKLEINKKYTEDLNNFKDDYDKYLQTGRFFTSTRMRTIKKGDLIVFMNFETDFLTIEKVKSCDGIDVMFIL